MRQGSLWMRLFPALWMRWTISIIIGAAAVVALIVFVNHNNSNSEVTPSPKSLAREARQAQVIVGTDQAPQTAAVKAGQPVRRALVDAVRADMSHRIKTGNVDGRLQRVRCRQSGSRAGRVAFGCVAEADSVNYPFVGVFTRASRRVTYCKRDPPPVPSESIPVSPRCTL